MVKRRRQCNGDIQQARSRRRPRCLKLERLESRCVPATLWDAGGDGTSWSDPRNWNPDQQPGPGDDVIIDLAGQYVIRLDTQPPVLGSFTLNADGATFQMDRQQLNVQGTSLIERGTVQLNQAVWQGGGELINAAILEVAGQAMFMTQRFVNLPQGRVTGTGAVTFVNTSVVGGVVQPSVVVGSSEISPGIGEGRSTGRLELGADFTLDASSVLAMDIGGLTAGVESDLVTIAGQPILDGTIQIRLAAGFQPQPCDRFPIINFHGPPPPVPPTFSGLDLADGITLRPDMSAEGISLVAYRAGRLINVHPNALTVTEAGASAAYQVCLGTDGPPGDVVEVAALAAGGVRVTPARVRFDPASDDWRKPELILVDAPDDLVAQGQRQATITHFATSNDSAFDSVSNPKLLIPPVNVQVLDNDALRPDRFEPNDDFLMATDLGSQDQVQTGLTIDQENNEDWFRWTAPARGTLAVNVFFEHELGDLDLHVYGDPGKTPDPGKALIWSKTQTDNEHVTLPVLPGEVYFIQVFGFYEAVQGSYDLVVHLNPESPRIYVAADHRLQQFDLAGNALGVIQDPLLGEGELRDVETGHGGLIYVALDTPDPLGDRIIEFTPGGTLTRVFPLPPEMNVGAAPYPIGFDVLEDGMFLVAQPNDGRVVAINPRGEVTMVHHQGPTGPQDATVLSTGRVGRTDDAESGLALINPAGDGAAWLVQPQAHQALKVDSTGAQITVLTTEPELFPVEAQELLDGDVFVLSSVAATDGVLQRFRTDGQLVNSVLIPGLPQGMTILGIDRPARVPVEDEDGDGLLDGWERDGLDVNGDGTVDLDLPGLGADPRRKDLFVEVDAMMDRAPALLAEPIESVVNLNLDTGTVLDRVVAAFLNAPVGNPDGSTGIRLHVQLDDTQLPRVPFASRWSEFDALKNGKDPQHRDGTFGTAAQRADANWPLIRQAKLLVYRYGLFADRIGDTGLSGVGELPGDDFLVTLGSWDTPGGTPDQQAGTFMHEFGHTLGLRHGGGDDINFKPNYFSVMNYHWQVPNQNVGWTLVYSARQLPSLDELALSEPLGIGFAADGRNELRRVTVGPPPFQPVPLVGPVDWDRDGQITIARVVQADVNQGFADSNDDGLVNERDRRRGELLVGHDDWTHLRFVFSDLQNFRVYRDGDKDRPEDADSDPTDLYDDDPPDFVDRTQSRNEEAATAFELFDLELLFGLTIHDSEDIDWFQWLATYTGSFRAGIDTRASFGQMLDLALFDDAGTELGMLVNDTDDGYEEVVVPVTVGQMYRIRVTGHLGAQGVYDLYLNAGDFNQDRRLDEADIALLCRAAAEETRFDLNGDVQVSDADRDYLVGQVLRTVPGDANLDGIFDSTDLILVFQTGQYEDGVQGNSNWASGDWNCDFEFDSSDLVVAFQAGGYVAAVKRE